MTIETVLTDVDVGDLYQDWFCFFKDNPGSAALCIRAIEQAVLQSPEVQGLLEDAAAFRLMVERRLTVSVSEVDADVEVFHEGACLAWPPLHQCKDDTERAAVAREAIHLAVSAMEKQP